MVATVGAIATSEPELASCGRCLTAAMRREAEGRSRAASSGRRGRPSQLLLLADLRQIQVGGKGDDVQQIVVWITRQR